MARDVVSMYAGTQRLNLSSGTVPKYATKTVINGEDVNLAGYDGGLFYIIPILYTDGVHVFTIQEADDNGSGAPSTYTNVATTDLVAWSAASITDFNATKAGYSQPLPYSDASHFLYQRIGYIGNKQWVRCTVTPRDAISTDPTYPNTVSTGASYIVISEPNRPRVSPAYV